MNLFRRKSRQRERIFEIIARDKTHPTAQAVYEILKKEMPTLSLGNVYRNIRILVEEGRIESRNFGDGIERFDAIAGLHYHFICERCKTVTDFPLPIQDDIEERAKQLAPHAITGHSIQFFGICKECLKK